jgi:hypothetical protein
MIGVSLKPNGERAGSENPQPESGALLCGLAAIPSLVSTSSAVEGSDGKNGTGSTGAFVDGSGPMIRAFGWKGAGCA